MVYNRSVRQTEKGEMLMRNTIKCYLLEGLTYLPIAKSDKWLSRERLPYDLIETCDGKFYEIRKTLNGALVALEVTDL